MKISYNWLKEFIDIEMQSEELAYTLTMIGLEVEEILDYSQIYDKFFVGQVTQCEKHPDADKLSVCKVNLGSQEYGVICGAPNVAQGQKVVLGLSGAIVPSAGFKLEKRKIRGIESNGMICAQSELELGDDDSGIWVLPNDAKVGAPLAEYLNLNDIIFELSITPNKADCLSHYGVARDIAAYLGIELRKPIIKLNENGEDIKLSTAVVIKEPEKCHRYAARVIRNIEKQESPEWLKRRLIQLGLRPINAPADVTNYVMMELGQPLHAFDLDELHGNKVIVRTSYDDYKFLTLDGKERTLDSEMLMICDAEKPVAIGGVMGGANTEISGKTQNILIESAYFNPASVRRTAKKLSINSDSSYRFERGVDPEMIPFALDRAAQLMLEICGGNLERGMIDIYPKIIEFPQIKLRFSQTRKVIGISIRNDKITESLSKLGFTILQQSEESVLVQVPSHRGDVSLEIDLIEEVARMINYDKIEAKYISELDFNRKSILPELSKPEQRNKIRDFLILRGFNETISQNQIDPNTALLFDQNPVKLANPLGEELSVMRPSMLPSMVKSIKHNLRLGNKSLALFEIGKIFRIGGDNNPINGYEESENLCLAITGNKYPEQWSVTNTPTDFYDLKGIAEELFDFLSIGNFKFINKENDGILSKNSLEIVYKKETIGRLGELDRKYAKQNDINQSLYIMELNLKKIYSIESNKKVYSKVSPYPTMERDLAFIIDKNVPAERLHNLIRDSKSKLLQSHYIFDIYEGENIEESKKSMAVKLIYSSPDRTLQDKDADLETEKIIKLANEQLKAELRK